MKLEGRLEIACRDTAVASHLEEVLTPDNVGVPRNQRFSMARVRDSLVFGVESETPASLFSTLISVLRDVALFQEVWLLSSEKDAAAGRRSR